MSLALTEFQQRLIDTGQVMLVGKHSPEIAEQDRKMVILGFAGNFGNQGLACTILRDDGKVLIVTDGDVSALTLRHEFIHAAQCFADEEVMADCLVAASEIGGPLVAAVRSALKATPAMARDYRDVDTTERLWRTHAAGEGLSPDLIDFQFYQDLYPTKATAALAAQVLGFDYPRGAYAAMTACLCAEVGYTIDPQSDFAREIVAYTFEALDSSFIDELMASAVQKLEQKAGIQMSPLSSGLRP